MIKKLRWKSCPAIMCRRKHKQRMQSCKNKEAEILKL